MAPWMIGLIGLVALPAYALLWAALGALLINVVGGDRELFKAAWSALFHLSLLGGGVAFVAALFWRLDND